MIENKIEGYAFTMLLIQLAFVLIGLTGIFPYSTEFAGFEAYDDIQESIDSITVMYSDISENGLFSISGAVAGAYILFNGAKILLEFILLIFLGARPLLIAVGLPSVFASCITALFDAVCIYGLSVKFLGR